METLKTLTLKEKAYRELRQLILKGELKRGEFLTERSLVHRLGMSRTPIRSALERLEVEGFINQAPNQGLIIAEMSIDKAVDIYDFRMALETYVVRKLANRGLREEEITWFKENLNNQKEYLGKNDIVNYTSADAEFHHKLILIYENKEILQAMGQIQDKLYQIALKVLRKDSLRIEVSFNDHVKIFENILSGNGEQAAEEIIQHLEFGKRILVS